MKSTKKKLSKNKTMRASRAGQFATKTLATLMVVALLSVSVVSIGSSANAASGMSQSSASRTIARHDRRMTLRASVLGVTSDELKTELKTKTFEQVVKAHGFKDMAAFHTALIGKLKLELKARGWSDAKINDFVAKREARYAERHAS